ncbi:hypothetical protein RHMOL_Rhmol07G0053100 [Rhododendron molle]|uniref:Uncharacterized protein n=1 Tax=Rhododendron molle TaxID=49168 RepID=A0ACC0MXY8_RHOML|nr:hypothetical protein RHMOL_Rhmol07G0053100 [Rhododendron molle]
MRRLFRSDNDRIKNSELVEYANVQEQLNHWTIPPVRPSTIYGHGTFNFKSTLAIKTKEKTESIELNDKIINLMDRSDLLAHMRNYNYIHIGLVQIALKPLTLLGMDTCLQVTLRDGRCNNWRSSIMGAIGTSLCHGPVYFNTYPNLSLSLIDRNIGEVLNCRIQTRGYDYLPGSEVIAVIYRIYYKVMNTMNSRVRQLGSGDQTVLIETNMLTSNIATNRIEQITQDNEGTVSLNFRNSRSNRLLRSMSSRMSNTHEPYRVSIPPTTVGRNSTSDIPDSNPLEDVNLAGIRISANNVPHGVYNEPHRVESPTASDMNFSINDNNREQLTRVENQVTQLEETIRNSQKEKVEEEKISPSNIRPPIPISGFNLTNPNKNSDLVKELQKRLQGLSINMISEELDLEMSNQEILELENSFVQNDTLNKIQYSKSFPYGGADRYYYPRPSPQDMLFEEAGFQKQMSYSGRTIYEWNIDGMTEYQIFGVIHQMMMYSTICSQNENSGRKIATWITTGFTGMIKGWWDNILSAAQRAEILTAIKIENNEAKEDAVYTLVQAIVLHFIGHWDNQRERSRELLQNLKCPTLTHFRWYKDVFLAKVMQRTDANSEHWKSKFVDGLPHFFAEKIRKKLRDQNNGTTIIYDNYTYGQLVSIIVQEGLTLCNDIKLHNQLKKQNLTGKQEVGQFCDQFGYDLTQYPKPAKKTSKTDKTTRKYSKKKSSKKNKKIESSDSKESTSKKHKKSKKTSDDSKKATAKYYIGDYYRELAQDSAPLYERLKKNPPPWTERHTMAVKKIKLKAKELPCLAIANPDWKKIVETDASNIGYGGILKQYNPNTSKEELVRFTSGLFKNAQANYSIIKKEILSIIKCINKFQDDLLNQQFLLKIDCSAAKQVLKQDIKNLASKQIFARWQSELSAFDFDIEYIKGENNSLPDFLTREFLQG